MGAGLLLASPESADARPRWGRHHGHHHHYAYSRYRSGYYRPRVSVYGRFPRYGSYDVRPYYCNFYGVGPNYWSASPYPRYSY